MVYVLYACGILTGKEREPERYEVTFAHKLLMSFLRTCNLHFKSNEHQW